VHRYERVAGQIIFPSYDGFVSALGDSKVSVCFPSSLTHPARSGDVETLTLRYLESIAARCVLLGHCPAELEDLFGYNPVIEADPSDPGGQLDRILADPSSCEPLLDRNLARLREVGTCETRVETMLQMLRERGYEPG
jgi:hypothetical protein